MNDSVAEAILFEGYMLYPYRRSALKNQRRWTFGVLEPGSQNLVCECLMQAGGTAHLQVLLRYFSIVEDTPRLTSLNIGPISVHESVNTDRLRVGMEHLGANVFRGRVEIRNPGPHLMASTQVLLDLSDGEWVPPRDPPAELRAVSDACQNAGLWPILIGTPGDRHHLLCSPIIVDDYAQVAPESTHAFFDATEIDELLALRIQTLSSAEQQEIASSSDARVRNVLHQVRTMPPEQLSRLHGARRLPSVGQRVRLQPAPRADILDLALAGREATIVAIEHDLEQRTYVAVTIDDDPGKDLGALGQPGHRFFFKPEELAPID